MPDEMQLHATISGRVQGIGFRFFVVHRASHRRLTGWVRNLTNGDVEVVAEGPQEALSELLVELREGPPGSWVRAVQAQWRPATGQYNGFHAAATAYE